MRDVDHLLDEALNAEERALLKSMGEEPGYFRQLFGAFSGQTGWINVVLMVAQTVAFVLSVWFAWRFFTATEALSALHWGLPAAVLLLVSLMLKMAVWPAIQTNRVLRELRRLELRLERKSSP